MKKIIAFILFLISLSSGAQNFPGSYIFNLKLHSGFVMNHSINMAHLANQRPWGVEADIYAETDGSNSWHHTHNYPIIGYSFQYFHMDPEKPLGDSWSAIIYYGKKFLKTKRTYFYYRIGIGPGYTERSFDRVHNYHNNLISSRFTFTLNGRINFVWEVHRNFVLSTGIGIIHHSNGAIKVPNLGINIPSVHIGIGYTPAIVRYFSPSPNVSELKKETQYNLVGAIGFKQIYPVGGPSWFVSSLSFYANRIVGHKSALNAGADIFFDASSKTTVDSMDYKNPGIHYFRAGILVGHDFLISRVSLLTQFGVYLYDPLKLHKPVYQRIGLKYKISDHVFAAINLKTHFGQAELVEWGLGVKF